MMIGGDAKAVDALRPIFETLAPGKQRGWGRVGPVGSGHFTKMVHNGIEYGLMQAYAEGFSILQHKQEFALDLHQVGEIWRYGSVVRSWLLDLTADALGRESARWTASRPTSSIPARAAGRSPRRSTSTCPAPVITLSLIERLRSRDSESFSDKLLAAMRNQFGGHRDQDRTGMMRAHRARCAAGALMARTDPAGPARHRSVRPRRRARARSSGAPRCARHP